MKRYGTTLLAAAILLLATACMGPVDTRSEHYLCWGLFEDVVMEEIRGMTIRPDSVEVVKVPVSLRSSPSDEALDWYGVEFTIKALGGRDVKHHAIVTYHKVGCAVEDVKYGGFGSVRE